MSAEPPQGVGTPAVKNYMVGSIIFTVGNLVLTSMRNCKTLEVRFRALLTQDETQQLEVVRA